jgi:hypothetical protein
MSKEEVFQFLCSDFNKSGYFSKERGFKNKFPEYYKDILTWSFPSGFKFSQKLYHYFNNDPELKLGLCLMCGNRCNFRSFSEGYKHYCSAKCHNSDDIVKQKSKETCIKKYGVENYSQCKEAKDRYKYRCQKMFGVDNYFQTDICKQKSKETCLEKYGVENYRKTSECTKKSKETCIKKYGVDNYSKTLECKEKVKQTNIKLYGVEYYTQTDESRLREYNTRKKNKTFNTSRVEQEFKKYLECNKINFIYQYKSDLYPFNCDFYIIDYDLYIEIQGNWMHGKHPYDKNNKEDLDTVNIWKNKPQDRPQYKMAIKVWTISDPLKRQTAKDNNLNWIEIFTVDVNKVIETFINTISKLNSKYE